MKYTAIINQQVFTRNSMHEYRTAGAWVHKQTGEIKNLVFSKGQASPSKTGVCAIPKPSQRCYYASKAAYLQAVEKCKAKAALWEKVVVPVVGE